MDVEANWRLCTQISLDDYHTTAVHPASFGRHGYVRRKNITYLHVGLHNAFLYTAQPGAFELMLDGRRNGTYRPTH
jgi:hypothetical protein